MQDFSEFTIYIDRALSNDPIELKTVEFKWSLIGPDEFAEINLVARQHSGAREKKFFFVMFWSSNENKSEISPKIL